MIDKASKADVAYKFIEYASHDLGAINLRVGAGTFPADYKTLADKDFLNSTTAKDGEGKPIAYFGGQKINEVLAQASKNADPHFRNKFSASMPAAFSGDHISKAYYGETFFRGGKRLVCQGSGLPSAMAPFCRRKGAAGI